MTRPKDWFARLIMSHRQGARIVFGIFFVLFLAIWKHTPIICGHLAASRRRLASRTTISGQIMGARQSLGLPGFQDSGFYSFRALRVLGL